MIYVWSLSSAAILWTVLFSYILLFGFKSFIFLDVVSIGINSNSSPCGIDERLITFFIEPLKLTTDVNPAFSEPAGEIGIQLKSEIVFD